MMVVVADTSPLNYLALIELIDVLPRLYGTVVVPQEVLSELTSPTAPREVREWARTRPDWIDVRSVPVSDGPLWDRKGPDQGTEVLPVPVEL